jgi:hypothetical protein
VQPAPDLDRLYDEARALVHLTRPDKTHGDLQYIAQLLAAISELLPRPLPSLETGGQPAYARFARCYMLPVQYSTSGSAPDAPWTSGTEDGTGTGTNMKAAAAAAAAADKALVLLCNASRDPELASLLDWHIVDRAHLGDAFEGRGLTLLTLSVRQVQRAAPLLAMLGCDGRRFSRIAVAEQAAAFKAEEDYADEMRWKARYIDS